MFLESLWLKSNFAIFFRFYGLTYMKSQWRHMEIDDVNFGW